MNESINAIMIFNFNRNSPTIQSYSQKPYSLEISYLTPPDLFSKYLRSIFHHFNKILVLIIKLDKVNVLMINNFINKIAYVIFHKLL